MFFWDHVDTISYEPSSCLFKKNKSLKYNHSKMMVLDIYLPKQKVCDAIQGINRSKSVNQEERLGDIYISSIKPTETCSTLTL